MDIGSKVVDQPGYVAYVSEVVNDSRDTIERFNERVRGWTERANIKLGEGTLTLISNNIGVIALRIWAPLDEGNWDGIKVDVKFPDDESCYNLGHD